MRLTARFCILVLGLAVAGCHKSSPPPEPPAPAAAKTGVSIDAAPPEGAPAPPSAPDAPPVEATASAAATSTEAPPGTFAPPVEQAMGQLTMFVQQYFYEFKRVPKDLSELVKPAGYLPYIYAPPAGKKWVIDAAKKEVKLADK